AIGRADASNATRSFAPLKPRAVAAADLARHRFTGVAILGVVLLVGAALRLWLGFADDGIYWPDEIYQSIEQGHRLAFGYGFIAPEFADGIRNWAFPALLGGIMKVSLLIGWAQPDQYLRVLRVILSIASIATAWACYRLARVYGASELSAAAGAALFALSAPMIYFGDRALSEVASTLPVTLGFALALDRQAGTRQMLAGASLLGLAVLLRLENAIFCLALIAILLGRRQVTTAVRSFDVLLGWAFLYGLIDRLTWGQWFHSALGYVWANVVQAHGSAQSVEAPTYYLHVLATSMLAPALCIAIFGLLTFHRAPGLLLTVAAFFALHTLTPHKELRFLVPDLPLACALAAIGADTARRYIHPAWAPGVMLTASVLSAAGFHQLSMHDVGQLSFAPSQSAYDLNGGVNRLLLIAGRQQDLCGIKVEATARVWTGGYSYLHRQVPFYSSIGPPTQTGLYDYVITTRDRVASGTVRAYDGSDALVRLPNATCAKDPSYSYVLPIDQ
ncbi:MAG TPA: hypothetical protein VIR57_01465, partial [Chloroflexota bacterium]